jgi:C4-dicarboxylate transporter DctM subunit
MLFWIAVILLGLLAIGLPISFVLGSSGYAIFGLYSNTTLQIIPHTMYNTLNSFPLMAVPFFILAADIMGRSRIGRCLVDFAEALLGHLPGGMAIVSVAACMIFAAISGSSVATASAIGMLTIPAMERLGYPENFRTGIIAAGGTIGILIPPSIPMILYGFMTEQSIGDLFLAGAVPGVLLGILLIAYSYFTLRRRGQNNQQTLTHKERRRAIINGIPAVMMPVMILGGIYSGLFTPTEASIIAVVYALTAACFIYKDISLKDLIPLMGVSIKQSSMIMLLIMTSMVFGNVLSILRVPQILLEHAISSQAGALIILFIISLAILIMGCFLEVTAVLLIVTPLVLPILKHMGIDLVHFAVIMVVGMAIGLMTPPVGLNLYVVSGVGNVKLQKVISGVWKPLIVFLVVWLLLILVPKATLWII